MGVVYLAALQQASRSEETREKRVGIELYHITSSGHTMRYTDVMQCYNIQRPQKYLVNLSVALETSRSNA